MEKEILVLKIADKGSDHREISKEVFIIIIIMEKSYIN
jgi:hypothetical protein